MLSRLMLGGAAALLLLYPVLYPAAPAQAHHCRGAHDFPLCVPGGGGGGAGGDESGKSVNLTVDISGGALAHDGVSLYVHKEGAVTAETGGETQPNKPGVHMRLKGTGKEPRMLSVNVRCTNPNVDPDPAGETFIGDCTLFPDGTAFNVRRAKLSLSVRPYEVNCPDPDPVSGECLDVFTLPNGDSAQMAFRVGFDEQILLEIASAIGGASASNPGRCLSLLSGPDQVAYLNEFCSNPDDCNVTVMAIGTDADGRNNAWDIVALNDTGLICNLLSGEVATIGVATGLTFTLMADETP